MYTPKESVGPIPFLEWNIRFYFELMPKIVKRGQTIANKRLSEIVPRGGNSGDFFLPSKQSYRSDASVWRCD